MRRLKTTFNCLLFVSFISLSATAQKAAIKAGDNAFNGKEYYAAIELYQKAYSQNPKKEEKARIVFQIAECYRMIGDVKHEESEYAKAVKANYDDAVALLYLADAQMMQAKYDDALTNYQLYQQKVPSDPRGANGVKSCSLAQQLKNSPTRYVVTNMAQLNTKSEEFSPAYSDRRMDEIIFTSTRPGSTGDKVDDGLGQDFSDLFITKLDKNGKFSAPLPLPAPVNTPDNEGSAIFDKAFKTMYFTRCIDTKNKPQRCKIYSTQRRGNNWTDPERLNFQEDSLTYGHPAITSDDLTLIFSSDMAGGQGGHDLWMTHYDKKTKTWGTPVNLGSEINTPGDEEFPYIHADGSLYYSSDGLPGMGGLDIFHAAKTGDNKWGNPTNLGYPINSEGNDFGIVFEGTKDRGYLSSDRPLGKGSADIYSFYLPPVLFVIEGNVYDIDTHLGISGATVRMVGSDGSDASIKTDAAGHFMFGANGANDRYVKVNTSYILSASATDLKYLASDEKANETTVGKTESETFEHSFQLKKPSPIVELHFPDVLYKLDSANFVPQAKDSLNYLVRLLTNNPTLAIELDANTDQQGDYNLNIKLSQARAEACVKYLISQGIDSARLTPKGWGYTRLLISTATINRAKSKQQKDSLYQINRRTVFKILSWDYVPKGHVMTAQDSLKMKAGNNVKVSGEEKDTTSGPVPEEERNYVPPVKKPHNNGPAAPQTNEAIKPGNN
jgi:peptidoglycan-associated lipoprotein